MQGFRRILRRVPALTLHRPVLRSSGCRKDALSHAIQQALKIGAYDPAIKEAPLASVLDTIFYTPLVMN